jgi:hypothetical protein
MLFELLLNGIDLFALRRVTYVGENPNGNVRKHTKEAVFLSVWCQLFRVGIKNLKEPGALLLNLSSVFPGVEFLHVHLRAEQAGPF